MLVSTGLIAITTFGGGLMGTGVRMAAHGLAQAANNKGKMKRSVTAAFLATSLIVGAASGQLINERMNANQHSHITLVP